MSTLIAVSALGFITLMLEIFNLRKILVPVVLVGLVAALGITATEYLTGTAFIPNDTFNMVVSTGLSQGFSMLFIILAAFIIAMSPSFYADNIDRIADYVSVKVFLLAGAIAMVSFGHLAMFFLGLEILSISGYVLAASRPTDVRSNEAGMKYFIMGAFASGFIVFGIAFIYGAVGSFDIFAISDSLITMSVNTVYINVGMAMVMIGLFFKVALFPFHFWAPDVYEGSPSLVTAMMSTLVKVAAVAALCKLMLILNPLMNPALEFIITIVSVLSMTVANITALRQTNIKRMMAYSGISHAGFMIMSLLKVGGPANGALYYAAAYSLAAMVIFAGVLAVGKSRGSEDVSNFDGLAKSNPMMAIVMSCALLSLSGIPIFAGFFAKLFMFTDMLEANHIGLVVMGIMNSIVALYYYFGVMNAMFLKKDTGKEPVVIEPIYKMVAVIAIVLNIILGVYPSIVMSMNI